MTANETLDVAVAAARALLDRTGTASDEELLADGAEIEQLGRLIDAHRLAFAAQVEQRSRKRLGEAGLAFRSGARDGVELVARTTRTSIHEARRRVGLGAALAPRLSLAGEALPGRHPDVAEAVRAGEVGIDAARIVVEFSRSIRRRTSTDELAVAEAMLTDTARTEVPEVLRIHAEVFALRLDPDGPPPPVDGNNPDRCFRLSRRGSDGGARFCGYLTAEHLAFVQELLASRRRTGLLHRTEPGGGDSDDDPETIDPTWIPDDGRTRPQQDYDTLTAVLTAGMQVEAAKAAATTITHEVVVHVNAADLENRRGTGWTSGILAGLPIPVVERIACTGGTRLLVTGQQGEPLHLGRRKRTFTAAQKKALVARQGGICAIPGCTVPHPYLDAHHARWWKRDHGPTDLDNGILVCAYHHALLHARSSPIKIVRHRGDLYVVPVGWTGPPSDRHRAQIHPTVIERRRGRSDPDPRAA